MEFSGDCRNFGAQDIRRPELFAVSELSQQSIFLRIFQHLHFYGSNWRADGPDFLTEDEEDAAVMYGLGFLCLEADHPGKYRVPAAVRAAQGAAGHAVKAETGYMRPLLFIFCLALCALGGTVVGAAAGNPDSGLMIGLAAGAAIASVFILLGGKTT